jgi:tRNA threonylcarbamoyladenosine biosynthesis protein TsaB
MMPLPVPGANMKILAIETATPRQSVALLESEQVLARADHQARGSHAKSLMPTINTLLASRGLTVKRLEGLAVSIGPGSFTGLRVGLATVLAFRLITGIPVVGVPTLEGLAWNLRLNRRPLCPALKARGADVYWALYRWKDVNGEALLECLMPPRVDPIGRLSEVLHEPVTVLGDGWLEFRNDIQHDVIQRSIHASDQAPVEAMWPSAVSVGLAGYRRLLRGDLAGPSPVPMYVQRAEAEIVWEARLPNTDTARVDEGISQSAVTRKL